jgi:miniconductance mechanosensitive channel
MVRQLDPTSKGMPLEIYCFTMKTWVRKSTIYFDHLLTIMSQFQLEIFEEPTGKDFRSLVDAPRELMSLSCILSRNVQLILSLYIHY